MRDESVVSYECLYLHSTISAGFSESDLEPQHPQKTKFMTRNVPCDFVKLGTCYSFESQLKDLGTSLLCRETRSFAIKLNVGLDNEVESCKRNSHE